MIKRIWKTKSSRSIFENDYWTYKIDEFLIGENLEGEYHYVHSSGSTLVIPVTHNNNFLLVNQFRYLNKKEGIEFPCGLIENGLSPAENALKELREESGFSARTLTKIGEFSPFTGASDEICTVFLARDLFEAPLPKDATEEMELIELSLNELEAKIKVNEIWDGLTLAAWSLARKYFYDSPSADKTIL